jgi:hypothetical protein
MNERPWAATQLSPVNVNASTQTELNRVFSTLNQLISQFNQFVRNFEGQIQKVVKHIQAIYPVYGGPLFALNGLDFDLSGNCRIAEDGSGNLIVTVADALKTASPFYLLNALYFDANGYCGIAEDGSGDLVMAAGSGSYVIASNGIQAPSFQPTSDNPLGYLAYDGTAGATATTGGATFKNGLYVSGSITGGTGTGNVEEVGDDSFYVRTLPTGDSVGVWQNLATFLPGIVSGTAAAWKPVDFTLTGTLSFDVSGNCIIEEDTGVLDLEAVNGILVESADNSNGSSLALASNSTTTTIYSENLDVQSATTMAEAVTFNAAATFNSTVTFTSITFTTLLVQPTTDATDVVRVENKAGTIIFDVDTSNSRVGVNTDTPDYSLDIDGTLRVTGTSTMATVSGSSAYWEGNPVAVEYGGTGLSTTLSSSMAGQVLTVNPAGDGLEWAAYGAGNIAPMTLMGNDNASSSEPATAIPRTDVWNTVFGMGTVIGSINTSGSVSAAAATFTSLNVSGGAITSAVWHGTAIAVGYGGTGLGSTPANGQLLVGNGSGYSLATLTPGTGVHVTNASGSITLAIGQAVETTSGPSFANLYIASGGAVVVYLGASFASAYCTLPVAGNPAFTSQAFCSATYYGNSAVQIRPSSDSTSGILLQNHDGSVNVMRLDTANGICYPNRLILPIS